MLRSRHIATIEGNHDLKVHKSYLEEGKTVADLGKTMLMQHSSMKPVQIFFVLAIAINLITVLCLCLEMPLSGTNMPLT